MKVFISWSGNRSRAVAEILDSWIRCVLQASRPWISTKNIDRGALWLTEINSNLQDAQVGIICLTLENRSSSWVLFEAGALAKGLSTNRVCTFLIDLEPKDITGPLAQFNHTQPTREGVRKLAYTLNSALGDRRLEEEILDRVFDTNWPSFEEAFQKCLSSNPASATDPPRPESDILSEILENSRSLQHRMDRLEQSAAERRQLRSSAGGGPTGPGEPQIISPNGVVTLIRVLMQDGSSDEDIIARLSGDGVPFNVLRELVARERSRLRGGGPRGQREQA